MVNRRRRADEKHCMRKMRRRGRRMREGVRS